MTLRLSWGWLVVAAVASCAAVAAALGNVPLASAGAALFAVAAAAIALAGAVRNAAKPPPDAAAFDPFGPVGVRDMFNAGRLGREDLVLVLDWLERSRADRALGARNYRLDRLLDTAPEDFRAYLTERVAEIEGTT